MPQQTAVQWLVEQIKSDQTQKALSASEWMQVIEKTKQMEREQIVEAFHDGMNSFPFDISRGRSELYYIEKYVQSTEENNNQKPNNQ